MTVSMSYSNADLESYLDETLAPEDAARLEQALRSKPELRARLAELNAGRDAGLHSLGAIWRRERLSCASRAELGSYLLDVLPTEQAAYLTFHLEVVACRYCQANLADLKNQRQEQPPAVSRRRQKFFQSSAGLLRAK
jgi:hypothetical protein